MTCARCHMRPRALPDSFCSPCRVATRQWLDAVTKFLLVDTSCITPSAADAERAGRLEPATRNSGAPAAPSLARELNN